MDAVVDPLEELDEPPEEPEEELLEDDPVLGELDVVEPLEDDSLDFDSPEPVDSLAAAVDAVLVPRESVR